MTAVAESGLVHEKGGVGGTATPKRATAEAAPQCVEKRAVSVRSRLDSR